MPRLGAGHRQGHVPGDTPPVPRRLLVSAPVGPASLCRKLDLQQMVSVSLRSCWQCPCVSTAGHIVRSQYSKRRLILLCRGNISSPHVVNTLKRADVLLAAGAPVLGRWLLFPRVLC